jgi:hypothetical protein
MTTLPVVVIVMVAVIAMEVYIMVMGTARAFRLGGGQGHSEIFGEN